MSKRFCDTDLWDKEWFMLLNPRYKCLIKFLWDKCDSAGVWSANWILASSYVGEKVTESDLDVFDGRIVKIAPGKFFCVEFLEFQYGTLSENCKPHLKIIQLLKKYSIEFDKSKGYLYPMHRVKEKDKDKEKEEEEDKDKRPEKDFLEAQFLKDGCATELVNPQNLIDVGSDLELTTEDGEQCLTENEKKSFDQFWDLYDKKVGKDESQRQWERLSESDKEAVLLYIPLYKKSQPEKRFRKDPERFLKKRAWTNEIIQDNVIPISHANKNASTATSFINGIAAATDSRQATVEGAKKVLGIV